MPRYYTGFRNFLYKVGSGELKPLYGAQKISFKQQTVPRSLTVRVGAGALNYSENIEAGKLADLDIVQLPVSFLVDVLGYTLTAGNVLVENAQYKPVHFSLFYEQQTDTEPVRTQVFDVCCVRPDFDVTTMTNRPSVDIKKLKLIINADVRSTSANLRTISREDNAELFDSWFGEATTS